MAAPLGGLRRSLQSRLLDGMIRKVGTPANKWKVLVVDREALRILSAALPVNELVNEGITIVEMLDMRREPLPRLPAIYFLTPSAESLQHLASETPAQYKEFHLFFTMRLTDFQLQIIRDNVGLVKRLRCLVELDVAFEALESRVFSLGRPAASLPQLHADSKRAATEEMSEVSVRLTEACNVVAPHVDWTVRCDATSKTARAVALLVKEQMETTNKIDREQQAREGGDAKRKEAGNEEWEEGDAPTKATLLVVDRLSDLVSPLVHEFSYQAIVHDLLNVDYRKPGGAYLEVPDEKDPEKTKAVQFDDEEKDPLWSIVRSMFVEEGLARAQQLFKEFLENDAAFKIRGKGTEGVDIKDMSAAVRALPDSQVRADKYALHIKAAKECLNICAQESITDLALIEQDLVVGRQSDGLKIRAEFMIESITEILDDESIPVVHRARVALIALIIAEGLGGLGGETSALATSATFGSRLSRAGVERIGESEPSVASAIKGLQALLSVAKDGYEGFAALRKPNGGSEEKDTVTSKLKNKYASRLAAKVMEKERAARRRRHGLHAEDDPPYDVARYNPPLRSVMMDLVDDELDDEAFPLLGAVSVHSIIASMGSSSSGSDPLKIGQGTGHGSKDRSSGGSMKSRTHSLVSGFSKSFAKSDSGWEGEDDRFRLAETGHLYMIFVVGGMCYSEVRAMQEVCIKREANILIGGSQVLTPSKFMDILSAVADPVTRIRVMLPPLPIELAISRAARAKALEAGRAKQAEERARQAEGEERGGAFATDADGNVTSEGARGGDVEVVTGYKKGRAKRLFGRKKK